ncbi:Mu homology domain-containing protein [Chytridium lagenaria]|nr:Mu homology domain-containing protein [Chytridium lagenaria]
MLSGFFIFNVKGEVLISRLYRPDIKRSVADVFRIQVISSTDVRSPITTVASTAFFHVKHENIYLVAFDEDAVKNNFTLIYELWTICDFGYPQNTEAETLKLFITTEGVKSEKAVMEGGNRIAIQATGAVAWRRPDIKYRKNEAFVDVIESVNLLMSTKGTVLRSDVSGSIIMRAYLSGMPECKFGLNDGGGKSGLPRGAGEKSDSTVELDDAQFHQCVKLANFEQSRTINFIPPDGEFELMKYRTTTNVNLPFRVHAVVDEVSKSMIGYKVSVRALLTQRSMHKRYRGKAKYVGSEFALVWKQQEFVISAEADLSDSTSKKAWSRPPISMDFQVLMFTSSGLMVRFLKIFEKSNYQSVKWVRYMTKAGSYEIRCVNLFAHSVSF